MDHRRAQKICPTWAHRLAAMAAGMGLVSCATDGTRAVMDARPRVSKAEWASVHPTLDLAIVAMESADGAEDEAGDPWEGATWSLEDLGSHGLIQDASAKVEFELLGEGPAQLDPGLGPVDLGYPLLVDLGAGDAPYDDGVETIHAEENKRGGFSDTVIQMHWRHQLGPEMSFHGGASMFRYQDLGILDGLSDARFGWAVLGIQFRF